MIVCFVFITNVHTNIFSYNNPQTSQYASLAGLYDLRLAFSCYAIAYKHDVANISPFHSLATCISYSSHCMTRLRCLIPCSK